MRTIPRYIAVVVAASGLMAVSSASAQAAEPFGRMVAMCAKMDLGERGSPPAVICVCNGRTMTFTNFGAMVQHMQNLGCTGCAACC